MQSLPTQTKELTIYISSFAQYLRRKHLFLIGPSEIAEALRSIEYIDLLDINQLQVALKAILLSNHSQSQIFDYEFNVFFRQLMAKQTPVLPLVLPSIPAPQPKADENSEQTPQPQQQKSPKKQLAANQQGSELIDELAQPQAQNKGSREENGGPEQAPLILSRLSPYTSTGGAAHLAPDALPELLSIASAVIAAVRLGPVCGVLCL